jgi:UDP-glucose 6-dehydrogenase
MKISIAGVGFVGLSNAVLLDQHNEVVAIDILPEKVAMLNRKQSPIENPELEHLLPQSTWRRCCTVARSTLLASIRSRVSKGCE